MAVVLLLFTCSANAGPYIEIGVGKNGVRQDEWGGRDRTGGWLGFGYVWHPSLEWEIDLGWDHMSQPALGDPFNGKKEDSNDSITLQIRYEWQ